MARRNQKALDLDSLNFNNVRTLLPKVGDTTTPVSVLRARHETLMARLLVRAQVQEQLRLRADKLCR
jgi:hypothetical protein